MRVASIFSFAVFCIPAIALLAGCVPPEARRFQPRPFQGVSVSVSSDPATPVKLSWKGQSYDDYPSFQAAIDTDLTASIDRLHPVSVPMGSLRLILPVRSVPVTNYQNPSGAAVAQADLTAYQTDIDQYRVMALRRLGTFSAIDVGTGNVALADNDGSDYVLWYNAGRWHLRRGADGDTMDINDMADVAAWAFVVNNIAHTEANFANGYLSFDTHFDGTVSDKPRYYFNHADYFSATDLAPAMMSASMDAARQIQPTVLPIGGSIKIVVPADDRGIDFRAKVMPGSRGEDYRAAKQAFYAAIKAGQIEALRRSKLFDHVDVAVEDVVDVPLGTYSVTLWHPQATPYQWLFRRAGQADARSFVPPSSQATLQQWLDALAAQLRGAPPPVTPTSYAAPPMSPAPAMTATAEPPALPPPAPVMTPVVPPPAPITFVPAAPASSAAVVFPDGSSIPPVTRMLIEQMNN